ncbi:MAG: M48 family metallopeptidase, partial [Planctomycetaceae bacterium]
MEENRIMDQVGVRCDWMCALVLAGVLMGTTTVVAQGNTGAASTLPANDDGRPLETDFVTVPPASPTAWQYYRSGNWIWLGRQVLNLLIPAALLFSGFSARLRDWSRKVGRCWLLTIVVYFFLYSLLTFALALPVSFYIGYLRQHAYGLSNQSFSKWFADALTGLGVATMGNCLLMWVPYWLLKRSPRRWWLYTSLLLLPFSYCLLLVTPAFIDPLFNDFGPMENKELEREILALAERSGIQGGRVFQVKKSVDTKRVNAYVTGIGNTKRIVLWDTLLEKLEEEQIVFIMGHEMGHYVLGHVTMLIFGGTAVVFLALVFIHKSSGWILRRYGDRIGFRELHDVASVPLMVLLLNFSQLTLAPVMMATSRYHEHEADRFGLELTRNNRAAATSFVELQKH